MASPRGSLATFYFFFFAVTGTMLPFWPLYLESLGFAPVQIGTLVAPVMVTKIVAPNVWGWVADRRGRRMALVRLGCFAATLVFTAVLVSSHFWWLALLMVLYSFFWNAALPQFEAVTLNHLEGRIERYTRIRLWGSVGFVIAVVALGRVVERDGAEAVPYAILSLLACVAFSSVLVSEPKAYPAPAGQPSLLAVLRNPPVIALLIYLEEHGYSASIIGALWALGVVAEVVVFAFMHRLVAWVGLRNLFLLAFGLTAVRWLLVALLVESVAAMVFAQLLHAASFGLYHAVAIQLVHRAFTAGHQGRGQALYSSVSFGAGGAAGALLAGYAWQSAGATATWLAASAATALALLVVWRFVVVAAPALPAKARFPLQ
jgi:PPP family 3-phenylpropionic acid transporter